MPNTYSTLANDAIVGPAMILEVAQKDIGDCADDAVRGQVILAKTHYSVSRLFDVDLPTGWWYPKDVDSRTGTGSSLLLMCVTFPGNHTSTKFAHA